MSAGRFLFPVVLAAALCAPARAGEAPPPPGLPAVLEAKPSGDVAGDFGDDMRREAMRAAALSYGAQSGLARRSWEIERLVERHAGHLDRLYAFRSLTLRRHGFTVVPPVVGETRDAVRFGRDGRRAASAARVVRIVEGERLAPAPPHWRDFLVRRWRVPEPPVSVLFPRGEEERSFWAGWIAEGWHEGRRQADAIFEADLDRLTAALEGMARWGVLRGARMVGAPEVRVSRAPTAGDGRAMRVSETLVRLGMPVELSLRAQRWRGFVFRTGAGRAALPVWPEAGP